jgi:hypothetical protein
MTEVVIGSQVFLTKKAALSKTHEVRERFIKKAWTSEDEQFLRDLVELHPNKSEKIGVGIDRFEVRLILGQYGFWIKRVDGSYMDFSFYSCLNMKTKEKDKVINAMRKAISNQTFPIRENAINMKLRCPISGEVLTSVNCHVDHEFPKFIEIANSFAKPKEDTNAYRLLITRETVITLL